MLDLDKIIFILKLIIFIMFLIYYFWISINCLVYLNKFFLDFLFYRSNKFNFVFKKSFNKLNFFSKFFLFFLKKENLNLFSFIFDNLEKDVSFWKKNSFFSSDFFYFYSKRTKNKLFNVIFLTNLYKKLAHLFNLKSYLEWLILQKVFFNSYFNLLNLSIFKVVSKNNLIKINFIIMYFLRNKKYSKLFNLNYYNDWFVFSFNKNNKKVNKMKLKNKNLHSELRKTKIIYIKNIVKKYTSMYSLNFFKTNFFLNNLILFSKFNNKFKNNFFKNLKLNSNFFKILKSNLPVRFFESSLNKYINFYNLKNYNFFYLRKNKIFNKGRYSRNRQLYRTGVYWCLWLNIIIVYGLYFLFYRFSFNFGYIWFGLFIIFFSTIFSRICKYNFFNIFNIYKEFYFLLNWIGFILNDLYSIFHIFIGNFFKKNLLLLFNNLNYNFYYLFYNINLIFKKLNKKKDYGFVFLWESYKYDDTSFLKYKSILNWFVQLYKVITY